MKKCVNGEYIEMTPEEIAYIEQLVAEQMDEEATRPMTMEEVVKLTISKTINAIDIADETALRMVEYYPDYADLVDKTVSVEKGFRFRYNGKLYRTEQPKHTFNGVYAPGIGTESLYSEVTLPGDGTQDKPIEYNGNMSLETGKYYTQNGVVYLCNRDTGVPVYHALNDLIGVYVEVVN